MKKQFTDQMQRQVECSYPPQRIISLVPSQTELLFYLGLEEEVVGITKFCIFPEKQFRQKTKIGGTKQVNFERIAALKPDLIIGNKEENERTQIESLAAQYPVWMSDIQTIEDAFEMILQVGQLVNREAAALVLVEELRRVFSRLEQAIAQSSYRRRVAYFIWRKPYMVAANQTFIQEMIQLAGFDNVFADQNRYPQISIADLQEKKPEVILLSSEPYPFKEQHLEELQKNCPNAVIKLVDGTLFSWYGNRLLHSVAYLLNLRSELQVQFP